MDDVRCTGNEDRLVDCPFDPSTVDCTHSEDSSVRCQITRKYNSVGFHFAEEGGGQLMSPLNSQHYDVVTLKQFSDESLLTQEDFLEHRLLDSWCSKLLISTLSSQWCVSL